MPYPNMGRPMPAQYAAPTGMPGGNPGAFAQRNAIAQALMNVANPPPQMPGIPPSFTGTAGPMSPPAGPQYGTTGGTAGPMPTAPPMPGANPMGTTGGTAGPMPTAPPQPGMPPPRPMLR